MWAAPCKNSVCYCLRPDQVTAVSLCIYCLKTRCWSLEEQVGSRAIDRWLFFFFYFFDCLQRAFLLKMMWFTVHTGTREKGKSYRRNRNLQLRKPSVSLQNHNGNVFWSQKYCYLAASCNNDVWKQLLFKWVETHLNIFDQDFSEVVSLGWAGIDLLPV